MDKNGRGAASNHVESNQYEYIRGLGMALKTQQYESNMNMFWALRTFDIPNREQKGITGSGWIRAKHSPKDLSEPDSCLLQRR